MTEENRKAGVEDLYGTWRLLSLAQRVVATGEKIAVFGEAPRGFLGYSRDGRMYAILAKDDRPKPSDTAKATSGEHAKLFNTMHAYAGTFTFEGKTVTHHVDISWNESWTGTDQVRNIRLEAGRLYISTNPQPDDADGRIVVWELVWEKIK